MVMLLAAVEYKLNGQNFFLLLVMSPSSGEVLKRLSFFTYNDKKRHDQIHKELLTL